MQTTTAELCRLLAPDYSRCQSPSLRLEKFLCLDANNKQNRTEQIQAIVTCCNGNSSLPDPQAYAIPRTLNLIARLEGNLIVNQAGGILENAGLCLDRLRGFPYVPGSAIKGVAHHAAWAEWQEQKDPDMAVRIAQVFGFPTLQEDLDEAIRRAWPLVPKALAGTVSFLAAVPMEKATIAKDICTSHHPQYYQGRQLQPFDNESPIPLLYPVVAAGTHFLFRIAALPRADESLLAAAKKWLIAAICQHGLGAKTAAGYGWFAYDETTSQSAWNQATAKKKRLEKEEADRQRKRKEEEEEQRQKQEATDRKTYLQSLSPKERLGQLSEEELRGCLDRCFDPGKMAKADETEKEALLDILKTSRLDLWQKIKGEKKGKNTPNWPAIVDQIRRLHKEKHNGEKMP